MSVDISWQQILDQVNVDGAIAIVNGKVLIDPAKFTGETYTQLSNTGVIEFVYKLLGCCQKAQAQINTTATSPNRLNSFGATTFGQVQESGGRTTTTATRNVIVRLPLDEAQPLGVTN